MTNIVNSKNQKGQAVLIILLSLSVVLIIVLFIMSRSVTDISLSTKDENALRAFSAAEAGVERVLITGSGTGQLSIGDALFNASVTGFAEGATEVVYPISLKSGENATFWFSRLGETNVYTAPTVKYCWGDKNTTVDGLAPALEITAYYLEAGVYKVARATLDPNSSRASSNNFSAATNGTCTIDGQEFQFYSTIGLPSTGLQYATAKMLYNTTTAHKVAIDGNGLGFFPSQGQKIISDGSYGDANRKLEVFQLHPIAPPVFANAIFSATGITK